MTPQTAGTKQTAWRVTRRFDGKREPEALLRSLIQAHKS